MATNDLAGVVRRTIVEQGDGGKRQSGVERCDGSLNIDSHNVCSSLRRRDVYARGRRVSVPGVQRRAEM